MLEVTCHADTKAEAAVFLEAVGIARLGDDGWEPIADCWISDAFPVTRRTGQQIEDINGNLVDEFAPVAGYHFNIAFHGSSEQTLRKTKPPGGWQPEDDLFDRTYILDLVAGRTGQIPGWVANGDDAIPPGYAVGSVRAFDPALISSRSNTWQA